MATHPVKLIAWTPKLGKALTDLTKGIGTTTLKQQEIQPPKQEIIPTDKTDGGGGGITLGAVTQSPAGGFGVGEATSIDANSDGTYSITSGGAVVGYINLYL